MLSDKKLTGLAIEKNINNQPERYVCTFLNN